MFYMEVQVKRKTANEELKKQQDILNQMIEDAVRNGIPVSQNEDILKQSQRVDALIVKVQEVKRADKDRLR